MATYQKMQAEIARLRREAETAKRAEGAAVAEKFKKLIALYGLTAADLGLDGSARASTSGRPGRKAAAKSGSRQPSAKRNARPGAGIAKYRDPKSGATWSGFGRIPGWLASVKDREAFRITDGEARTEPEAAARPAAKPARKTGAKAATKHTAAKRPAAGRTATAQAGPEAAARSQPTAKAARKAGAKAAAKRPAAKKRTAGKTAADLAPEQVPAPEGMGMETPVTERTSAEAAA